MVMTKEQVIDIVDKIKSIYPFVNADKTYLNIWYTVTRKANFEKTIKMFYRYITDPSAKHHPPIPADIVVNDEPDYVAIERAKQKKWEEAARKNPPKPETIRKLREFVSQLAQKSS